MLSLWANGGDQQTMNAEQLAAALGAKRSGRQFKCRCVAHEDRSPSMIIFDGRNAVQVRCLAGCEPADIIAVLKSRGLWHGDEQQEQHSQKITSANVSHVSHETRAHEQEQRMRVLARCIFDDARPIEGTLAQRYFESRDLWTVARMVDDIRFHPRCPFGAERGMAVVMAMRHVVSNAITAVQRIQLNRQGRKIAKGMMLGTASGAAMKLMQLQDHQLHICEGLETGLAVIAMDRGPVWALGSTSLIQSFPVLDDINELTIWADHDPVDPKTGRRPGFHAAAICERRWLEANKRVAVYSPRKEGWDEADVWSARCARL
jgi:putative DNA primase/helicase